jgi:hypothetical protein
MRYRNICVSLILGMFVPILGTGCATTDANIGHPQCREPEPVTREIWNDIKQLRQSMSDRDLIRLECIEMYKERIRLHDDNRV